MSLLHQKRPQATTRWTTEQVKRGGEIIALVYQLAIMSVTDNIGGLRRLSMHNNTSKLMTSSSLGSTRKSRVIRQG